jgi:hypothetical protein
VLQATTEGQALPLQGPALSRHHKAMGHGRLLMRGQQAPPEGQHQPSFAGEPPPLTGQHWPVGEVAPTALAGDALKQGRMGFHLQPLGALAPQAQAHHPRRPVGAGRLAMAGALGQQGLKTAQLVTEGQGAVGIPLTLPWLAKPIEPGATPTAQPTAQQAIGQGS